jgi:hypothetical protein
LPEFPLAKLRGESNDHFLARVKLGAENVVGSYIRTEHHACISLRPKGGRLNWVFKQAGVAYGPHLEPGSEASKEAAKKRNNDAGVGPVGKRMKVPGKKKAAAPKAHVAPKGVGTTS